MRSRSAFADFCSDTQPDHLPGWGQYTLSSQPISVLLGTQLGELRAGRAELRLPATRFLQQQHGVVHGGVLAYLADNAIGFAASSLLGGDVVTEDLKLNHLRPARGRELVALASVVHSDRSFAVCRCDISAVGDDGRETLCAVAQGAVFRLPTDVEIGEPG